MQCEYDTLSADSLIFILRDVLCTSWICDLVSVINFWKILSHYYSKYFLWSFLLLVFPLHICHTFGNCPKCLDILLCIFHSFFSLHFSFRSFYWHTFKLTDSFLDYIQSSGEPSKSILHFSYSVFISIISFWFFLRVYISLLIFPICFCMSSTSFIRALSILFIVILNSQSDNSKISAIPEFHSAACFVSSYCFCFVFDFYHSFWFFFEKQMMYQVIGTKVNMSLVWGFSVYLVGIRLCLIFSVDVILRSFNFL